MIDEAITIQMLAALRSRLEGEKKAAMAEMMIYLRNPTGVGEHSNLIDDLDKMLSKLANANDKLEALTKHFQISQETTDESKE